MATKFTTLFRPHTLPFLTFYSPPRPPTKSLFLSSSTTTASSTALSFYGPSLHKGYAPFPLELPRDPSSDSNTTSLDECAFTRVFDISALRVPSHLCSTLENRLRGHLLNWPRINNIARVPGDEIDPQFKTILPNEDENETENLMTLNRRIYGKAEGDGEAMNAVLYRDKLARSFNSRGYVKFRNLARISRPKQRKKKKKRDDDDDDDGEKRMVKRIGRNEVALVEVVEDEESDGREDLRTLLGEDVPRWRGSTRLLLLDERYTNKKIEELPEAIKVSI